MGIEIGSATRIHVQDPNIDWPHVNTMPYSEAMAHIQKNTHTVTGFSVFTEYMKESAYWLPTLTGILYIAAGYLACLLVLLFWIGRNNAT